MGILKRLSQHARSPECSWWRHTKGSLWYFLRTRWPLPQREAGYRRVWKLIDDFIKAMEAEMETLQAECEVE